MTKKEADLIIAEQNKSREEILKAVMKIKSDWQELYNLKDKRIAELEQQIEKMKCCENCAWWYKLPNGQRDCAETCENLDNWSFRKS